MMRKIGGTVLAVVAAAALLAAPAGAASYRMMFDILSPPGIDCAATPPPGGAVRLSRGIAGNPVVFISGGNLREAQITCTLPDGSRWQATAHQLLRARTAHAEGMVLIRNGAPHGTTLLTLDGRDEVVMRSFTRLP